VGLQKQVMTGLEYQWASAETCISNVSILIKLVSVPHRIKIDVYDKFIKDAQVGDNWKW